MTLTLCLTRRSSSDSSLVGRWIGAAAASAGACACAAAAAAEEQCRGAGLRPHCTLLGQLPLLCGLDVALKAAAGCLCCDSSAAAHVAGTARGHGERLLANGRYRWSSHLGASLLHAMSWLCCAMLMLEIGNGDNTCTPHHDMSTRQRLSRPRARFVSILLVVMHTLNGALTQQTPSAPGAPLLRGSRGCSRGFCLTALQHATRVSCPCRGFQQPVHVVDSEAVLGVPACSQQKDISTL